MKRFLLWLVGVVLGVGVFLGAVMGVSYAFTTEGSCPDSAAQFGTEALESNGACWQVPLIGGQLDKVFASPATLTVQKLGILYTAHPALTLPDWSVYTTLTIRTASGETVFTGTASEYESFLFPANGEYKAELTVWRVPEGGTVMQFEGGSTGVVRRNLRLEKPAKPTGWYRYAFRFTLQASAEAELSAERVEQGGVVGLRISGMTGDAAPTVETDLGNVQCVRAPDGWRAYIPAAYNASSGGHEVNITVNGETVSRSIVVLPRDFGTVDAEPEPDASEAANTQFRNAVWGLYEAPAREKLWQGGFVNPVESYTTLWITVRSRWSTAGRAAAPTPQSSTPFPASPAAPRQTAWWCWPQSWPSPETRWSLTTAAGCAATCTGCRHFLSLPGRRWKRGRPWACWARS